MNVPYKEPQQNTLTNAVLALVATQQTLIFEIREYAHRIDVLTTMMFNENKRSIRTSNLPMSKRELTTTAIGVIVFGLVVLGLILGKCACAESPARFDTDPGTDTDTDTGLDTDTDTGLDTDTDTGLDTDTDTGLDTDTGKLCPWACKDVETPSWMTCDKFAITDGGVPDSIVNYNYLCGHWVRWCCQPWPAPDTDTQAVHDLCGDTLGFGCRMICDFDDIDTQKACFHAATVCCRLKWDEK